MFKRALLCVDGTRESRDALRQAAKLVAALKAETHVLVVSNLVQLASVHGVVTEVSLDIETSRCRSLLDEGLDWLRQHGVEPVCHVKAGTAVDVIAQTARDLCVDLVIVGHVARSPLGRWWAGSENTALSDRLRCSLLILSGAADP